MRPVGLVVPLYQEADRFEEYGPQLLDFLRRLPDGSELVFVDDGSTDGTAELVAGVLEAQAVRARLIRRPHRGKGAAVAAGLAATDAPIAAFCDLDLSTPLDQLALVLRAADRADVLAIGSRDLSTSVVERPESRLRETLGRAYNRLLQATLTPGIVDTQCGAKAAARGVWRAVLPLVGEKAFAWDAEVVAVAVALGIPVQEVPVIWRHDDRSKVRVGRDGLRMVAATPRIWRRARHARGDRPLEERHWWFRSKAALVATAIRRTGGGSGILVDLGGGGGGVTVRLGWDPGSCVVVERDAHRASAARHRHGVPAVRGDAAAVPLRTGAAAVVCLLDVVEHVEDPAAAVAAAAELLGPGGRLVVTVPAHRWLWSAADVRLGHLRRYDRAGVEQLVGGAGLDPVVLTHVFSWLLPPLAIGRRLLGRDGLGAAATPIDRAALVLTALERLLVGRVSLPLGSSVLCVAVRR